MANDRYRRVVQWAAGLTGFESEFPEPGAATAQHANELLVEHEAAAQPQSLDGPALTEEFQLWKLWDEQQSARRDSTAPARPGAMPDIGNTAPPAVGSARRAADVAHVASLRLMTVDELQAAIGHAPHQDRLGGLWKMSVNYKRLQNEVAGSHDRIRAMGARPLADLKAEHAVIVNQITAQIDRTIAAAQAYEDQHDETEKTRAPRELIDQATTCKADLAAGLASIAGDPAFAAVAPHITIDQALAVKSRGINFADCTFDIHNDDRLDKARSHDDIDSGSVSSVSKLVYQDGVARIFKPEPQSDARPKVGARLMGIDPAQPHYGNRNVASRAVAEVLGAGVMPDVSFTMHNGEVGLLMTMAEGRSPRVKEWRDVDQEWAAAQFPEYPDNRKNLRLKDSGGKWIQYNEVLKKPWDSPLSPKLQARLQAELNSLEWTDMLTGQVDRHSANYLVDIKGDAVKVIGIDNDFAFGRDQDGLLQYNPGRGVTSPGEPGLIDRKIHDRLLASDFDRDLLPKLQGLLTVAEIDASRHRFNAVVTLARTLEAAGCVVDDWSTWRSRGTPPRSAAEYLAGAGTPSLFKRDLAGFFAEDGLPV
jgi:hypothetical protein